MLTLAFWILLLAAIGGLAMAALDIAVRPIRIGHGLIAGIGLAALFTAALIHDTVLIWTAFTLVAVGFTAGAFFFGVLWRDRVPPRGLIVGHGMINAIGIILLAIAMSL